MTLQRTAALRRSLLRWFAAEQRPLPWRQPERAGDPYCVWVSEIMLQQTRVSVVIPYYERFLAQLPNVQNLAAADEQQLLGLWSGLGYYRRARQMQAAARQIVSEHGGSFPRDYEQILRLPGIGRYTAGAVASIAFGTAVPAVDGNVVRVARRLEGALLSPREVEERAAVWARCSRPGQWNQALMELGATVCTPRQPRCQLCPLLTQCASRGELEGERKKQESTALREHYALLHRRGRVLLRQRPASAARMAGMWELPEAGPSERAEPVHTFRHTITRYRIEANVYHSREARSKSGKWFTPQQASAAALTGLTRKILRKSLQWDL